MNLEIPVLLRKIAQKGMKMKKVFGSQGFANGEEHLDADWNRGIRGGYNFTRNFGD